MPLAVMTALLAEIGPEGWTNKEVLGLMLGTGVPTAIAIFGAAFGWMKWTARRHDRQVDALQREIDALRQEKGDPLHWRQAVIDAKAEAAVAGKALAETAEQLDRTRRGTDAAKQDLDRIAADLDAARREVDAGRRRVARVLGKDGATWTERVPQKARRFERLDPERRRTPIVSLLNLKGGVGKTTATANLGVALARLGWRVLLLDLDLQGSLTGLFLTEAEQEARWRAKRLVGDLIEAALRGETPDVAGDYGIPVLPGHACDVVPTNDSMAYAEINLTLRWFLREDDADPRFLLQRQLHRRAVTDAYDIVLLDCPPLLNVSCVNALAASDYVLVPVMPSKAATDRVPALLTRLKEFHDNMNVDLRLMGAFANRTREARESRNERGRLDTLAARAQQTWPQFRRFTATIPQSVEVRAAEDERRPVEPGSRMDGCFLKLAEEVVDSLPTFCRPTPQPAPKAEAVS